MVEFQMEDGKDEPNWNNFNKYLVIQSPGEQELRLVPWVGRRLGSLIGLMFMPRFSLLRTNEKPRNGTPRNLPSPTPMPIPSSCAKDKRDFAGRDAAASTQLQLSPTSAASTSTTSRAAPLCLPWNPLNL
jgi:hypothetical protein